MIKNCETCNLLRGKYISQPLGPIHAQKTKFFNPLKTLQWIV